MIFISLFCCWLLYLCFSFVFFFLESNLICCIPTNRWHPLRKAALEEVQEAFICCIINCGVFFFIPRLEDSDHSSWALPAGRDREVQGREAKKKRNSQHSRGERADQFLIMYNKNEAVFLSDCYHSSSCCRSWEVTLGSTAGSDQFCPLTTFGPWPQNQGE